MFKPGNCTLALFRKLLLHENCKPIRTVGGHEVWSRSDLQRPIIIQTHIDPVPEFIVLQTMRALKLSRKDMEKLIREL
jgi:hypothetical protein